MRADRITAEMTNGTSGWLGSDATMTAMPVAPSTGHAEWRSPIDARATDAVDERAIAAAVLAGDTEAYRLLVDRESSAVVRACLRVLGDLGEAEDVAQEAFVIAYRSLAMWRADGPFGAWLSRIAIRLAIRQLGRRRPVSWIEPDPDAEAQTDPADAAIRGERADQVRAAVASLGDPYRETVALRFFADRSLDEIAAVTGRPLGTVKTHLRRGLIQLRDRIESGGPR